MVPMNPGISESAVALNSLYIRICCYLLLRVFCPFNDVGSPLRYLMQRAD